jgi:hypothetical protein
MLDFPPVALAAERMFANTLWQAPTGEMWRCGDHMRSIANQLVAVLIKILLGEQP